MDSWWIPGGFLVSSSTFFSVSVFWRKFDCWFGFLVWISRKFESLERVNLKRTKSLRTHFHLRYNFHCATHYTFTCATNCTFYFIYTFTCAANYTFISAYKFTYKILLSFQLRKFCCHFTLRVRLRLRMRLLRKSNFTFLLLMGTSERIAINSLKLLQYQLIKVHKKYTITAP